MSTCIISHYLNEINIPNQWLDVRDLIRTDNNFRDATIDWDITAEKIQSAVSIGQLADKSFSTVNSDQSTNIFITQGFVGATDANESTTLGREGSDYSAAVFVGSFVEHFLASWTQPHWSPRSHPVWRRSQRIYRRLQAAREVPVCHAQSRARHAACLRQDASSTHPDGCGLAHRPRL